MSGSRLAERLLSTLLLMLGIAVFIFFTMRLLPGDPVDLILGQGGQVTDQQIALLHQSYHLDDPIPVQLATFLGGLVRGDLGTSIVYNQPVTQVMLGRLPATIELAVAAIVFALLVAVPVAIVSALRRNSLVDRLAMTGSFLGISMPSFWLGIVLILVFSLGLHLVPVAGRASSGAEPAGPTGFFVLDSMLALDGPGLLDVLAHLALPAVTMGAVMAALLTRVLRSSLVEELGKDYVISARARGASTARVVFRHALRNALIPTVTVFGLELGSLLGGNMIVETVFGWPGIGRLIVDSVAQRDLAVLQVIVMLIAVLMIVTNLLVDLAYSRLDPRTIVAAASH